MVASLLALVVATFENSPPLQLHGGARAYFESAYLSSSGRVSYTEPVAEQCGYLSLEHEDYGSLSTDFWMGSALNKQTDSVHRRAFYCYEGTVTYGNAVNVSDGVKLSGWGGIIWDWLGGYKHKVHTPIGWISEFKLANPYLTPYVNALGFFENQSWTRIRFGVNRRFVFFESLSVTPFLEATWGDAERYRQNYGGETDGDFFGGALMFTSFGLIAEWTFCDNFYLWGRYRQYVLLDHKARDLVSDSDSVTAKDSMPIFGLGVGFRF